MISIVCNRNHHKSFRLSPDDFREVPRCSLGGCPVQRVERHDSVSTSETIFGITCHGQTRIILIAIEEVFVMLDQMSAIAYISGRLRDPFPLPRLPPRLEAPRVRARGRALPAEVPGRFTVWEMPEAAARSESLP